MVFGSHGRVGERDRSRARPPLDVRDALPSARIRGARPHGRRWDERRQRRRQRERREERREEQRQGKDGERWEAAYESYTHTALLLASLGLKGCSLIGMRDDSLLASTRSQTDRCAATFRSNAAETRKRKKLPLINMNPCVCPITGEYSLY